MRSNRTFTICCLIALVFGSFEADAASWKKMPLITGVASLRSVQVEGNAIYLVSAQGLLRVDLMSLSKNARPLYQEACHSVVVHSNVIYLATDKGVRVSRDNGLNWKAEIRSAFVWDLAVFDGKLWAATETGLMARPLSGSGWTTVEGSAGYESIRKFMVVPEGLLLMGRSRLYLVAAGRKPEELFSRWHPFDEEDPDKKPDEDLTPDKAWQTEFVGMAISERNYYLAARDAIFQSSDNGRTWQAIPGIPDEWITSIAVIMDESGGALCFSSFNGIHCADGPAFKDVYQGLEDVTIHNLHFSFDVGLLAVSSHGVYQMTMDDAQGSAQCQFKDYNQLQSLFSDEPDIQATHRMAIRYADVGQDKIDRWQRQSRMKTLLPTLSLGLDRSTGELFHWDTGGNPDNLMKGRETVDWDVTLSWQFSDLIWSTDQTSIDSRSKISAEFRNELLDQVTRIYFERRRLQVELASCQYLDSGEKMAAQLRVDELTALLNSFTNGQFSGKQGGRK